MKLTVSRKEKYVARENCWIVVRRRTRKGLFFYSPIALVQFLQAGEKKILFNLLFLFLIIVCKSQVVINEIGIAPLPGNNNGGEFIELFNKSACTVDLSCYTIVFSSTSGGGNASGWTIKFPSGYSIASGSYFVIGGVSGQAGIAGTGYPTGGTPKPFLGTANLDVGTIALTANAVYMLRSLNPVTFPDGGGQLTLLNSAGSFVSSVAYGSGNNAGSYPLSAYSSCDPSGNTKGTNNIPDPGNSVNYTGGPFSSAGNQGIYLNSSGVYQATTMLTPGSANPTQTLAASPLSFVNLSSNSPLCERATLNLTATASGGTGLVTYSWTGPSGFSSLIQNPSVTNITTAASGSFTIKATDADGCTVTGSIDITINPLPALTIIYHN